MIDSQPRKLRSRTVYCPQAHQALSPQFKKAPPPVLTSVWKRGIACILSTGAIIHFAPCPTPAVFLRKGVVDALPWKAQNGAVKVALRLLFPDQAKAPRSIDGPKALGSTRFSGRQSGAIISCQVKDDQRPTSRCSSSPNASDSRSSQSIDGGSRVYQRVVSSSSVTMPSDRQESCVQERCYHLRDPRTWMVA